MSGPAFGMDIGGSSIKLGAWDGEQCLAWRDSLALPDTADQRQVAGRIAGYLESLAADHGPPAALGIGSCGIISGGVVLESPNTPWDRLELVELLKKAGGYDALLVNDADAFLAGALNRLKLDAQSAIGITLGTGVGTAVMLDGRTIAGGSGVSPEAGHITINFEGGEATTGIPGTFEYFCGIAGLSRCYGAEGGDATPKEIARLADDGDGRARAAWTEYGTLCGVGLGSLCNVFMPEMIVIGGGLAQASVHFDEALRDRLDRHMLKSIARPRIEYVEDQPDLVAWGAAVLALERAS